jgi:hypothetical protein
VGSAARVGSCKLLSKKLTYPMLQIINGGERIVAADKSDVSTVIGKFDFEIGIVPRLFSDFVENLRGKKRIVNCAQ